MSVLKNAFTVSFVCSCCTQHLSEAILLLLCVCGFFQDNNGVIGLVEPLKTSKVPVKLPMIEPVVKIASGKTTVISVVLCCRVFPLLKSASLPNRQRPRCDGDAGGTSLHSGHRRAGAAGESR